MHRRHLRATRRPTGLVAVSAPALGRRLGFGTGRPPWPAVFGFFRYLGFFLPGRFFPDGFPRRRHGTLADACLAIAGIAFGRLLFVMLLGLLINRPAAAGLPFTGLSEIGLPALRFVLAGFGVRGSLAAGARPWPRTRSVCLPGFGVAAVSLVDTDGVRRWGGMSHRVAGTTDQQSGSYDEAGRGDAPTRTHFGTTLHTHRQPENLVGGDCRTSAYIDLLTTVAAPRRDRPAR